MKTLDDLAKKLHRKPWSVVRMLKSRGYLKRNGEPKQRTIDAGYMTKNCYIKNKGWNLFLDELARKDSGKKRKAIKKIVPEIYIFNETKSPFCTLCFRYGNMRVDAFSTKEVLQGTRWRYLRDKDVENKAINILLSLGFTRKEGKFHYKGNKSFLSAAEELLRNGFRLFDKNEKSLCSSKSISCSVSYGIDWFNISLTHEGTELSSFVYNNLNKQFFEVNGKKYLLPSFPLSQESK